MDVRNRRVTVMGLGSFGGGVGVAQFLAGRGARVTVTDLKPAEDLASSLEMLAGIPLAALHLGGHREVDFTSADLIVASPAVPSTHPYLELARQRGVPVTTEICLVVRQLRSPWIGVTGSNGKSTTAALIHALLCATGRRAWLGGNIGGSLLQFVDEIASEDPIVLELSSFQLEYLAAERRSPHVAVVTNFSPNHLDRHGTLDAYRLAKQKLLRFQRPGDVAVLNNDDGDVRLWAIAPQVARLGFGFRDPGSAGAFLSQSGTILYRDAGGHQTSLDVLDALQVPGRHNIANALAAVACAAAMGVDESALRRGLAGFRGLPHRLERVAEIDGRTFYNDSIATTPESACAALDAFDQPVILIAGGYDKGIDLKPLAMRAGERAKAIALIGQTARELLEQLAEENDSVDNSGGSRPNPHPPRGGGSGWGGDGATSSHVLVHAANHPPVILARDLDAAVRWAWQQSSAGDVILLSPGCASYDQFRNFQHRGEVFRAAVERLRKKGAL